MRDPYEGDIRPSDGDIEGTRDIEGWGSIRASLFAVAVVLSACAQTQKPAAEVAVCPGQTTDAIIAAAPPGTQITQMDDSQAEAFVRAYNAEPPASDLEADEAYIAIVPGSPAPIFVLSNEGCFVVMGPVSVERLNRILSEV